MATIGSFTQAEDGFTGAIKTLLLNTRAVLKPVEPGGGDKAPDYRVLTDKGAEIGAAWRRQARSGAEYFSVKLDDPSLVAPIHASLVATEEAGGFNLIWSRGLGRA